MTLNSAPQSPQATQSVIVSSSVDVPEVTVPTIEAAVEVPEAEVEQSIVEETRKLADEFDATDA